MQRRMSSGMQTRKSWTCRFLFWLSVLDLFSQSSSEWKYFNLLQKLLESILLPVQKLRSRTLKGSSGVLLGDGLCAEPWRRALFLSERFWCRSRTLHFHWCALPGAGFSFLQFYLSTKWKKESCILNSKCFGNILSREHLESVQWSRWI